MVGKLGAIDGWVGRGYQPNGGNRNGFQVEKLSIVGIDGSSRDGNNCLALVVVKCCQQ